MAKWIRLFGKKRGSRMSGWWLVGRVGEAAFFGILLLLGIVSLTTVVTWQVFWTESNFLRIGFGFWLMVIASSSFIVIGLTGFTLKVTRTLASPERRNVLATKVKRDHQRRSLPEEESRNSCLPSLNALTDSPGVKLAYRLAEESGQRLPIILSALFAVAWNTLVAVLMVIAVQNALSGKTNWLLVVLLVPFVLVSIFATGWFFRLFRTHAGIGPTAVEISDMPLLPGRTYHVYVCQYGRTDFSWIKIRLAGYEEATYQQGTDVRTERSEFASYEALSVKSEGASDLPMQARPTELAEQPEILTRSPHSLRNEGKIEAVIPQAEGTLRADPENPLELVCQIKLPHDMMHSFYGMHNSIRWKIVVEGEASKWPTFRRNFPVVVYPRDTR